MGSAGPGTAAFDAAPEFSKAVVYFSAQESQDAANGRQQVRE
jgi:hypothetical protein